MLILELLCTALYTIADFVLHILLVRFLFPQLNWHYHGLLLYSHHRCRGGVYPCLHQCTRHYSFVSSRQQQRNDSSGIEMSRPLMDRERRLYYQIVIYDRYFDPNEHVVVTRQSPQKHLLRRKEGEKLRWSRRLATRRLRAEK